MLYVCVEDARVVRAALCAGRARGLTPTRGAVWLLPAALPPAWLAVAAADAHNCTQQQLHETAEGHLSVAPAWLADWDEPRASEDDPARLAWSERWRQNCCLQQPAGCEQPLDCVRPSAHAALLYDTLRMWDASLRRQLHSHPKAIDNLHHKGIAR